VEVSSIHTTTKLWKGWEHALLVDVPTDDNSRSDWLILLTDMREKAEGWCL
jgi:hypothetical protein